ncbi:glycosyltransferase family 9 protein [Methanococcus aeolicus]|uniref:glycosyltransferase family 9 protein n=1 Tax=Methanococcus aeolicus TaxID=42879 RepID=UPI0021C61EBE|nr:glycosyltransferase family 9 protein [Methanococcus aeolicus]UXM85417.1 lipopolysaccharide heptosyltransferase family protein [Methanococcus aeolicus]
MKILVIAISGIGNLITFLPALDLIKKKMPNSEVDFLVRGNGTKYVLLEDERVNKIYENNSKNPLKFFKLLLKLRKEKYDAVITIYPSQGIYSAIIMWIMGGKLRIQYYMDYILKFLSSRVGGIYYNDKYNLGIIKKIHNMLVNKSLNVKEKHAVYLNINLVKELFDCINEKNKPVLHYYITKDEIKFSEKFWNEYNLNDNFVIGIHPGTGKYPPFKRWNLNYWGELIKMINEKYKNIKFLVFIGPFEDKYYNYFNNLNLNNNLIIIKGINLRKSISLISKCNFFISADSGLSHCASLFKIPQITMFGPVDYNYIHPFSENCKVVVPDNYKPFYIPHCGFISKPYDCMKDLKPEKVFREFEEYLGKLNIKLI